MLSPLLRKFCVSWSSLLNKGRLSLGLVSFWDGHRGSSPFQTGWEKWCKDQNAIPLHWSCEGACETSWSLVPCLGHRAAVTEASRETLGHINECLSSGFRVWATASNYVTSGILSKPRFVCQVEIVPTFVGRSKFNGHITPTTHR